MAMSLLSLAIGKSVSLDLAMTGEITLMGYVLHVGGIKEKVIGARIANIHKLILPEGNQKDYEELPEYLKKGMDVHFVSHFMKAVQVTLGLENWMKES
mgnify:CR=1 FL=1